jgi:eukaryotic-like serine/threonine-protein kinase
MTIIGGRYRIVAELGRGSFGQTYLAEDINIPGHPQCVVKQFKPFIGDSETLRVAKKLFIQEAEILANLGMHPQIPTLLAYYENELCLIQQYIEGKDLSAEIVAGQKLDPKKVIAILKEILEILVFVHNEKVIHRDIKPSNIIRRNSDGKLILIDFGAVKRISALETNVQGDTLVTVAVGTPGFMPSEQQQGRPSLNSDIYALGIMAIESLTGMSPTQLMEDRRYGKQLLQQEAKTSKRLMEIIDKMVKPDWRERYASVEEVLKDLNALEQNKFALPRLGRWGKLIIGGLVLAATIMLFPYGRAIVLYNRANTLLFEERYSDALAAYDEVAEIFPNSAKTWYLRSFPLSKLKRFEEMLASCRKAVEIEPQFYEAWNCEGLALDELGEYDRAIAAYEKVNQIQPDYYEAWNNKGETLLKQKQLEAALEAFDKAKLYNSNYLFAWNNRGNTLFQMGRYAEAIAAYSKAIEIDTSYKYAWHGRANASRLLGRCQTALSDYDMAIQLDSQFYEAVYNQALAYICIQKYENALNALDRAIIIKPDYKAAIDKREEVLSLTGNRSS